MAHILLSLKGQMRLICDESIVSMLGNGHLLSYKPSVGSVHVIIAVLNEALCSNLYGF